MAKSEWMDNGGSVGSATPEFGDVQDAGEPWPSTKQQRSLTADLAQLRQRAEAVSPLSVPVDGRAGQTLAYTPLHQSSPPTPYGAPISKEELLEYRKRLFAKLDGVLLAKGNDYNAAQQEGGDTLFNLRTCAMLGVVPTPEDGILVRLSDKLMRLVSLTRPATIQKVKDESIEDTGGDAINYITYLLAMRAKKAGLL